MSKAFDYKRKIIHSITVTKDTKVWEGKKETTYHADVVCSDGDYEFVSNPNLNDLGRDVWKIISGTYKKPL